MTELDFLLELLLQHKLPKPTQLAVKERIALIQQRPAMPNYQRPIQASSAQAPSMAAKVAALEEEKMESNSPVPPGPITPPTPVTAGAAQALMSRQQAIQEAMSPKPPPGRTSPRKF